MSFDLNSLDVVAGANEGADIALVHPVTLEKLSIKIKVAGKDSDLFKKIVNKQNRARLSKAKKSRSLDIDPDELEADTISILSACTLSWEGMELDGKPLEFSTQNAQMVYTRFPWIREQIDVAVNDRANFMKG